MISIAKVRRPSSRVLLCIAMTSVMGGCSAFRPLVDDRGPQVGSSTLERSEVKSAEPTQAGSSARVALGQVNGKTLYSSDLDRELNQEIARSKSEALQREMHLRWVGFRGLVGETLLDEEAERLGISREELYRREVVQRVTRPPEDDVKRLYEANRARFQGASFQEVSPSLTEHLMVQRREALMEELVERLVSRADVKLDIPVPALPRERLDLRDAPFTGPANAPVTIVEFADYECPYCAKASQVMKNLRELYPNDVKVVYLDFPLERHPFARVAAEAAHCMHLQGHFWAYHDMLFDNLGEVDRSMLADMAARVGGDRKEFQRCMETDAPKRWVKRGAKQARELGLNATPSIFINGVKLLGLLPLPLMQRFVDNELQRSAN